LGSAAAPAQASALLLHEAHDGVVDHLGFSGGHEAPAVDAVANRFLACAPILAS
jgi:hypothetical protein